MFNQQQFEDTMVAIQLALKNEDVNAKDFFGTTALHLAVNYGQLDVVKLLLQAGADVFACNNKGSNALHATTTLKGEHKQEIINLLLDAGLDINSTDSYGQTALHLEARWGDDVSLNYLINKGASISATDKLGATALHYAAFADHLEQVKALLLAGSDINAVTHNGQTVRDWAELNPRIVRELENFKLALLIENEGDLDSIKETLYSGAQANSIDYQGFSFLHLALNHSKAVEVGQLLLKAGAVVDRFDPNRRTPLHWAVVANNIPYAEFLLNNGSMINNRDNQGLTALQLAQEQDSQEMVLFLKRKGGKGQFTVTETVMEEAVALQSNQDGFNSLHKAIEARHSLQN